MSFPRRTRVGIIGANPAGLLLARLLHGYGVNCAVLESRGRPPVYDELVNAHSPRGFAPAGMRSPAVSRLYLQVPNGTDPAAWSEERIRDELDARLAPGGSPRLKRGPLISKSVLPMRSQVTEPMYFPVQAGAGGPHGASSSRCCGTKRV